MHHHKKPEQITFCFEMCKIKSRREGGKMWCCGHIEDAMPSSFNVLLQTKAHPKIIMLFGLATKKSALKV